MNDLCGAGGRWDTIARSINSALFLSHDLRRDTSIHLIMTGDPDPPKVLTIDGSRVKYLNPDERASVALLRKTLEISLDRDGGYRWINPGIYVSRTDLKGFLERLDGILFFMDEKGIDFHSEAVRKGLDLAGKRHYFILSDDLNPVREELDLIEDMSDLVISVGPKVLHGDHAIIVLHNLLDRLENEDCNGPETA
ncbi:MAG: tRNA (pseudouridine(54)-N(1))-methyltransferase TrmY [Thermoplasmatota archaeon]